MGKLGDITLTKQTGTVLTLATNGKYVNSDVSFDIGVQSGAATVTVASTDAAIEDDSSNRNVSSAIGSKSSSAPSSGYYLKVAASGTGSSTVTTAGWLAEGSLGTATASGSFYFPVNTCSSYVSGSGQMTPLASLSGSNVTLSNTNNGISITSTGGGSVTVGASLHVTTPGYVGSAMDVEPTVINVPSQSTNVTSYISGVTIPTPASGTNTFAVTLPNGGSDTITLTFAVDASGNWTIE